MTQDDLQIVPARALIRAKHHNSLVRAVRDTPKLSESVTLVGGDDIDITYDEVNGTLSVAVVPDFPNHHRLRDHFLRGATNSGLIGELGWISSGTITQVAASSTLAGAVQLATGTTSGTVGVIYLSGTNTSFSPTVTFDVRFRVRLDTGNADTAMRIGLMSAVGSGAPANGIYFGKDTADSTWHAVCRASSTETKTNTTVATSSSFATFRIRRLSASTIGFSIDGGTETTVATNVPSAGLIPALLIVNAAAANKTCAVDWFDLLLTGLGAA